MSRFIDLEDPAVTARKKERLEQSKIRLEQKAAHMEIQRQKIELAKARKREEKLKKLRKIFSLYYVVKTAKTLAALGAAVVSVMFVLRQMAEENPEARALYIAIMNKLELIFRQIRRGITVDKNDVSRLLNKISYAIKLPYEKAKESLKEILKKGAEKTDSSFKRDSMNKKILNRMILDEWHSRCNLAFGTPYPVRHIDSSYFTSKSSYKQYKAEAMRRVDMAIIIHDTRYNDLVGMTLAINVFKKLVLPQLILILKQGAIAGVAAAVAAPLKKATEPIIGGLIEHIKKVIAAKPEDQTYIQALCRDIKFQFQKLLDILKREGSYAYGKLNAVWQKIKNLI